MTMLSDGTAQCDHCHGSAGNGGVINALQVSDVNFTTGITVTYHLCRNPSNSPMCCDLALSAIPAASGYPHSGSSTDDAGTG